MSAKIEELPEDVSVEEVAATNADSDNEEIADGSSITVYSRAEKKARKALVKLGLKKVEGINRVVLKRSRDVHFVIANPEVYKSGPTSYIVFGEAKAEDYGALVRQASALQNAVGPNATPEEIAAAAAASGLPSKDPESITADLEAAAAAASSGSAASASEPIDDNIPDSELISAGLSKDDLNMIKDQTSSSNGAILKAYKENAKDVINTIVALTS